MECYALSKLEDGKAPAFRAIADPADALPGEVVVEEPPGEGEVWDQAAGAVRPRGDGEEMAALKAAMVEEIAAEAVDALAPMFTDGAGRDETVLLVAGHVLKLCEALNVEADPRLSEVVATGEKALRLKAEIEAAGSAEELEGLTWPS